MTLNNPKGCLGYAAEFQSSALPWVTSSRAPIAGSPVRFDFPKVSRFITLSNIGAGGTISLGFTRNGVISGNKFVLLQSQSVSFEVRVRQVWLQGEVGTPEFSLFAGLTNIDANNMPELSGTLANGDPGWTGIG